MRQEERAVRLILAVAVLFLHLLPASQNMAQSFGCCCPWLFWLAAAISSSITSQASQHQFCSRISYTQKSQWYLGQPSRNQKNDGSMLAAADHSLVHCRVTHLQHVWQQQTQPSVFKLQQPWKHPASNSRASEILTKTSSKFSSLQVSTRCDLWSQMSRELHRESQALFMQL